MGLLSRSGADQEQTRLERILAALQAGAGGGLTANWNDELFGNGEQLRAAHDASPGSYAVGEALGSLPLAFVGAGLAQNVARGMGPKGRLIASALAGALHGAAAGSGGFRPGDMTAEERLRDAGLGAALGAGIGGLGVPATRAVRSMADNAPAILGRETLAEGGVRQVLPFTGTRASAPLSLSLAGEGDAAARAQNAIQAALSQDEAGMVRDTGRAVLGRFANEGRNLRAFGSDNLSQSMTALRDLGAQSPGGAAQLEGMASDLIEQSVKRNMRAMRAPKASGLVSKARMKAQEADDFVRTMDAPEFHRSWLSEARKLGDGERASLAAKVVRALRTRAKNATGSEAEAFQRYLRNPTIADKLKALGVNIGNLRNARKAGAEVEMEVERLRALARRPDNASYNFRNWEDRDLASRGSLGAEDATALLNAMMQPQRAFAVRPDSMARALTGQYERGVHMDPRQWFNAADIEDVMGSVRYAQPAAAGLPGLLALGSWRNE